MRIKRNKFPLSTLLLTTVLLFFSCVSNPDIYGKWQRVDDKGMIEFRKDGSFTGIDNMGAIFKGKYTVNNGNLKIEITHSDILRETIEPERSPEIINAKISTCDDALQFLYISDDGKISEIEKYRRESPRP